MGGCQNMVNIVLVGKTGNGKSATANSILRENAFESELSFKGVTTECQQRTTEFNGRVLNVIDTPGLFDSSYDSKCLAGEIARCVSMAECGIHAVLIVLTPNRFTEEEKAVIVQLQSIFGDRLCDYIIVVFTHGDVLKLPPGETNMNNRLGKLPDSLKELLQRCNYRNLVFDNMTKEEWKKSQQIRLLLEIVDDIGMKNNSEPYTDTFFLEYQKGVQLVREKAKDLGCPEENVELEKLKLDQMQSISLMVIVKLTKLEQATRNLQEKLSESHAKISKLESDLEAARIKAEEDRKYAELKAKEAEEERKYAELKVKEAEEERKRAEFKAMLDEKERKIAEENARVREEERKRAEEKARESESERKIAKEMARIREEQQKHAEEQARKSEEERKKAEKEAKAKRERLQADIRALNERVKNAETGWRCTIM